MPKTKQPPAKTKPRKAAVTSAAQAISRGPKHTRKRIAERPAVARPIAPTPAITPPTEKRLPKKKLIATMLAHLNGTTLADLTTATGWQSHSIRAAMTGLRKAGHQVARFKDTDGTSRFRLTNA